MKIAKQFKPIGIAALALLIAAGCATTSHMAKKVYYFYPPPPDDPHLQFLTGFSSERAFHGRQHETLMTFLTGVQPSPKDFAKPYGVAAANHKLYICDTDAGAVLIVDLATRRVSVLNAQGEGGLSMPLNIAIDSDGNIYVADAGREQVVIFDKLGNYVAAMGKSGEMKPRDVAVDKNKIYVADMETHSIRIFDRATRNPLADIPSSQDRTNRVRGLFAPTNLALDSHGNIYVGDTGAFRVQVYDANGNYLRSIGEMGDSPGQFARVKGVALDHDNRLYAVDAMSQMIQIFNDKGQLLTYFSDPNASVTSPCLPAKVFVDYDDVSYFKDYVAPGFKVEYLVIVINQLGPHMVSVYGFGEKK
jgi:sugar lactone lactonase YvrE